MQVKIWDPSIRCSELCATLKGHSRCLACFYVFVMIYLSQCVDDPASSVVIPAMIDRNICGMQNIPASVELESHDAQVCLLKINYASFLY